MLFYFTMCMFIFNLHCQLVLCYINIRPNVKFPLCLKKAVLVSRNIAYLRKNQSTLCRILGLYSSLWMKDAYICVLCGCWFSITFEIVLEKRSCYDIDRRNQSDLYFLAAVPWNDLEHSRRKAAVECPFSRSGAVVIFLSWHQPMWTFFCDWKKVEFSK